MRFRYRCRDVLRRCVSLVLATTLLVALCRPAEADPPAPTPTPSAAPRRPIQLFVIEKPVPSSTLRTAALVGLATGAATIGAGAFFGYRAADVQATATLHCQGAAVCDARGAALHASADAWRNVATGTLAIGGGLMLAGGILFAIAHFRNGGKRLELPKVGRLHIEPGLGRLQLKATF